MTAPSPGYRSTTTQSVTLLLAIGFGFVLGAALLWVRGWGEAAPQARATLDPEAAPRVPAPRTQPDAEEQQAIQLFRGSKASVVNVDTVMLVRRLDMRVQEQQTGTGSGIVWDEDGRIVTNFHVIKSALVNRLGVRIVLADRTAWDATLVGVAPDFDLAVLKIKAPKEQLKPIAIGRSNDLEVGQKVFAIGNPYGLSLSMTRGIISAIDREIESPTDKPIAGAIQTDAPINPGNSGGPLLDKDGRLIGVNTAIATPSGGNVGIGFAIPVDTVNQVVTELIQRGRLLQPDLGIKLVDQRRLRRAGFANGVMVQSLEPDSPAARAGLRGLRVDPVTNDVEIGDIILGFNGVEVNGNQEFMKLQSKAKVGEKVRLTIERNDQKKDVDILVRGI